MNSKILSYLSNGHRLITIMGFIRCNINSKHTYNKAIVTDGKWIWDTSIIHYIKCHKLAISNKFFEHIIANK